MNLLGVLSLASFLLVVVFTSHAYCDGGFRREAIVEAWLNVVVGFSVNYIANFLILPLIGAHVAALANFEMGWIYTAVSIIRQYAIRRWFQRRIHAAAVFIGGGA